MTDKPPADPADHAEDFSRRYAEDLDIAAGQAMMDLGIANNQMGVRDPDRNREPHSFFPSERTGGSVSPAGQITLDSGLMNPELLADAYDEQAGKARSTLASATGRWRSSPTSWRSMNMVATMSWR